MHRVTLLKVLLIALPAALAVQVGRQFHLKAESVVAPQQQPSYSLHGRESALWHTARVKRLSHVVYAHNDGVDQTMDVFTPLANANGAGIVWVVSGGWTSAEQFIPVGLSRLVIDGLTERGYTVFAVVPRSQPLYTIPSMQNDVRGAVDSIYKHARAFGVDPCRLGITGGSSGGQLALMAALGREGKQAAAVCTGKCTCRPIAAVACLFPPIDFLNYGGPGISGLGEGRLRDFPAPFAFDNGNSAARRDVGRSISPYYFASADDPPTLIIQGDSDPLVPEEQAQKMIAKLRSLGVPAKLVIKAGGGHGWPHLEPDIALLADWFDRYLPVRPMGRVAQAGQAGQARQR